MLSFALDRGEYTGAESDQDGVWILYRLNHQSCLIIGVFDSRDSAFAYAGKHGPVDESGWLEPHPGQRHWQYDGALFTYFLEQHQVRCGTGSVHDAMVRTGMNE